LYVPVSCVFRIDCCLRKSAVLYVPVNCVLRIVLVLFGGTVWREREWVDWVLLPSRGLWVGGMVCSHC
jgi:hypothetical protein